MSFTLAAATPQIDRRLVRGLGLSLLAHAIFLSWWLPRGDSMPSLTSEPVASRLSLRLLPVPILRHSTESSPENSRVEKSVPRDDGVANAVPEATAIGSTPRRDEGPASPTIDVEGVRQSARRMRKGDGPPTDPLAPQPRDTSVEAKVAKVAEASTRISCLDAYSGTGLLAPLFHAAALLADKKDTGCRY